MGFTGILNKLLNICFLGLTNSEQTFNIIVIMALMSLFIKDFLKKEQVETYLLLSYKG